MTGPQDEVDLATLALQAELARLAVGVTADSLALWNSVPPQDNPNATAWLSKAIQLVMTRRRRARELGRSYYRLVRALTTESTVADYHRAEETHTNLNALRREFASLTDDIGQAAPGGLSTAEPGVGPGGSVSDGTDQPRQTDRPYRPATPAEDDLDRILIEELKGLEADELEIERQAEEELATALAALGPNNMTRKLAAIDPEAPTTARQIDQERAQAHAQAGSRQAAASQRVALNGARSALWNHADKDRRVVGYVRVSRTGTPCGWCAMLISRGPVYKSEASATYGDGDLYHDNCHCYAIPVFSDGQYDSSPLFDLNRKYEAEWPRVTRGLSGKAAVSAWRKHIRNDKASAQAARGKPTSRPGGAS